MNKARGHVSISGTIAYVPQTAWIMNTTLKNNILFGRDYDKQLYDEIIEACALKHDLGKLNRNYRHIFIFPFVFVQMYFQQEIEQKLEKRYRMRLEFSFERYIRIIVSCRVSIYPVVNDNEYHWHGHCIAMQIFIYWMILYLLLMHMSVLIFFDK